jgi:hypothetical protein
MQFDVVFVDEASQAMEAEVRWQAHRGQSSMISAPSLLLV